MYVSTLFVTFDFMVKFSATVTGENSKKTRIIENDENHDDIHHIRLKIDQDSFPIRFNLTNIKEIKQTAPKIKPNEPKIFTGK